MLEVHQSLTFVGVSVSVGETSKGLTSTCVKAALLLGL